jgi:hypothetical protein
MFFFFKSADRPNPDHNNPQDWVLYDKFTTALTAGNVNGTSAEPVGGARTVTDTNSKITIAGGVLNFATGEAANDGVWYTSLARALGKTFLAIVTPANTGGTPNFGWDNNTSGVIRTGIYFAAAGVINALVAGAAKAVGVYTAASHNVAIVLRGVGAFYFIKGGAFTNWTLLYTSVLDSDAGIPAIATIDAATICTADNIRVPDRLYIPVPLQSDGMSGALTDGAGHAEANGAVGNAYTNVGTWGVAAGARSCSVLDGSLGFSYLPCTSSNVIIDAEVTRSAGVAGIVARYADADNYLIAYHDGTNAKLDKVVGGSTTSLVSAAATYAAGAVLRLILDDTSARLFYNNAAVGAVATTPAAGSLNHGLYTTDTGNTFDDLAIWARGNEGQYGGLNSL